jgi:hypothetical protein
VCNGQQTFKVVGPLHTVTWDSVSFPSHPTAKMTKISEGMNFSGNNVQPDYSAIKVTDEISQMIYESIDLSAVVESTNEYICTENGVCYLPNDYDRMIETRKNKLMGLFI